MIDARLSSRGCWFTSSYSNGSGACVEVKFADAAVLVRDSKDRRGHRPLIAVGATGWTTFLSTLTTPTA